MDFSLRKAIGGALLVGGTAIGAGMLALPVVTGMGGFLPSTVIFIICWIFSACTGLLLLEVCLWMPNDANIISMVQHLLGPVGKIAAWILYIFLFYCLAIAYVDGRGICRCSVRGQDPLCCGINHLFRCLWLLCLFRNGSRRSNQFSIDDWTRISISCFCNSWL